MKAVVLTEREIAEQFREQGAEDGEIPNLARTVREAARIDIEMSWQDVGEPPHYVNVGQGARTYRVYVTRDEEEEHDASTRERSEGEGRPQRPDLLV